MIITNGILFIGSSRLNINCNLRSIPRTIVRMTSTSQNTPDTEATQAPGLLKILENNPKRLKRINFLGKLFEVNNHELRIAGGAVRDIIMGKSPHDIDFATTARPEQSLEILNKHQDLLRIIVTTSGQRHGTVAVKFKEGHIDFKRIKLNHEPNQSQQPDSTKPEQEPEYDEESPYEITTLRCDILTDGRHAEVEFINDWKKDAERRDLTINAMFLTLDDGRLIDYFGGEDDLKNGVVRFVGDADLRIKEDYLRILRYFRFWSRYGRNNQPDEDTSKKLQANKDGLDKISGERIWQEIKKIFSHLPCCEVMDLMLRMRIFDHAGLLDPSMEDYDRYCTTVLDDVKQIQENVKHYTDNILSNQGDTHHSFDVKKIKELLPVILFSATVRSEELCLNSCLRMKFANFERDAILYLVENRDKDPSMKALKYQLALLNAPDRPQMLIRIVAYLISKGKFDLIDDLVNWEVPQFPISGNIVSQELKEKKLPGKQIKPVIETLRKEWARSDFTLTSDDLETKLKDIVNKL